MNEAEQAAERVGAYLDDRETYHAQLRMVMEQRLGHIHAIGRPKRDLTHADLRAVLADRTRQAGRIAELEARLDSFGDEYQARWQDHADPAVWHSTWGFTTYAEAEHHHQQHGLRGSIQHRLVGEWEAVSDAATGDGTKKTPDEWCEQYGLDVRDSDGWRGDDALPWETPITLPDFWRRYSRSTVVLLAKDDYDRIVADVRAAKNERTTP